LNHEVLDNAVKSGTFVTEALLAGCKGAEVLSCLGSGLAVEAHSDAAERFVSMSNVEIDLWRGELRPPV